LKEKLGRIFAYDETQLPLDMSKEAGAKKTKGERIVLAVELDDR
jgi:hypothetical protein